MANKFQWQINSNERRQIIIDKSGKYVVKLIGKGASAEVLGSFLLNGKEKLEINIEVIHKAADTKSDVFIRVVCKDRSEANLKGIIKVKKKAKNTDAYLKKNVLLLSSKACAEVVPNLEIEADEVKCSHAATVGKIDEEQIFYLRSRGLKRKEAEGEIVKGFLNEVEKRIKE